MVLGMDILVVVIMEVVVQITEVVYELQMNEDEVPHEIYEEVVLQMTEAAYELQMNEEIADETIEVMDEEMVQNDEISVLMDKYGMEINVSTIPVKMDKYEMQKCLLVQTILVLNDKYGISISVSKILVENEKLMISLQELVDKQHK